MSKVGVAWISLLVISLGVILFVDMVSPAGFTGAFDNFVGISVLRWSALLNLAFQPMALFLFFGKSLILIKGNLCATPQNSGFRIRALLGQDPIPLDRATLSHGFLSYLWYSSVERYKVLLVSPGPATGGVAF